MVESICKSKCPYIGMLLIFLVVNTFHSFRKPDGIYHRLMDIATLLQYVAHTNCNHAPPQNHFQEIVVVRSAPWLRMDHMTLMLPDDTGAFKVIWNCIGGIGAIRRSDSPDDTTSFKAIWNYIDGIGATSTCSRGRDSLIKNDSLIWSHTIVPFGNENNMINEGKEELTYCSR
jgi:hypothetical protein